MFNLSRSLLNFYNSSPRAHTPKQTTFDECLEGPGADLDPAPQEDETAVDAALMLCPGCEKVVPRAVICLYCGEILDSTLRGGQSK